MGSSGVLCELLSRKCLVKPVWWTRNALRRISRHSAQLGVYFRIGGTARTDPGLLQVRGWGSSAMVI
jgi:hypothetical protein